MKKGLVVSALVGATTFTALAWTSAHGASGWMQRRGEHLFVAHLVDELDLTQSQREQIKAILQKERPEIREILQKVQRENAQLRGQKSFNEAVVRALAQKQAVNLTDAIVEREKIRDQVLAVLTAEQQEKFSQVVAKFRNRLSERLQNLGDQL